MAKRYAVLTVGQSNAEPSGVLTGGSGYFAVVPELNYTALTPYGGDPLYGKASRNLKFLTFYNSGDVATYPVGTPPPPFTTWEGYGQWLEFTHLEGPVDNPHPLGFQYPNCFHRPLGQLKDSIAPGNPAVGVYGAGVSIGVELGVRLHGLIGETIYVHNAAISGTQLQFKEPISSNTPAQWGWFDARYHNCWAPGDSDGLFARLLVELDAAKLAAEDDGDELEYIACFISLGEAEASVLAPSAQAQFPVTAPKFVAAIRQALFDRGLCSTSPHYFPVIWEKLGTDLSAASYTVSAVNTVLDAIAKDDPCFGTYETTGFSKPDGLHFDVSGIRARGEQFLAKFQEVRSRIYVGMSMDDVPTLDELRGMVKIEVERNTGGTDTDDAVLDKAINDTLDLLYQTAGDSAWWLEHKVAMSLESGSVTEVIDLPRTVTRLMEIRPMAYPLEQIEWTMVGHSDNGRVQIVLGCPYAGMVNLHCIFEPRRLVSAGERPVLPRQYLSAVVAGAAWRVVHQSGNAQLELKLQQTADRLMERVSGHINKVLRQKRQVMTHSRGRRNTPHYNGPSYRRGYY